VKHNHAPKINALCKVYRVPHPVPEFVFAKPRKWRFDFAFPEQKIALEVEGGIFTGGAHTRGKHFLSDIEKYNRATILGWRVLRCTPQTLITGVEAVAKCLSPENK
jgi:very-short-patch-repair endonuclease